MRLNVWKWFDEDEQNTLNVRIEYWNFIRCFTVDLLNISPFFLSLFDDFVSKQTDKSNILVAKKTDYQLGILLTSHIGACWWCFLHCSHMKTMGTGRDVWRDQSVIFFGVVGCLRWHVFNGDTHFNTCDIAKASKHLTFTGVIQVNLSVKIDRQQPSVLLNTENRSQKWNNELWPLILCRFFYLVHE